MHHLRCNYFIFHTYGNFIGQHNNRRSVIVVIFFIVVQLKGFFPILSKFSCTIQTECPLLHRPPTTEDSNYTFL